MMKKPISIAMLVIMACAIALPMIGNVQASPQTILEIDPETTTVEACELFTVDVAIVDVNNLAAYEFKLGYDPNILEVVDVVIPEPFSMSALQVDGVYTGVPTVWMGYDCDVVPDGVLDIYDIVAIRYAFASEPGDPRWNPRADINQDGIVNIHDVGIFRAALIDTFVEMPGHIFCMGWMPGGTFSGNGILLTITLESWLLAGGETVLDLYDTKLSLIDAGPIPHSVRDGTVIVTPVTLAEATQYLKTTIESWNLPTGTEKSLTGKLKDVINLYNQNNLIGAVQKLEEFIAHVDKLLGRGALTDKQANYLKANAQTIIDATG